MVSVRLLEIQNRATTRRTGPGESLNSLEYEPIRPRPNKVVSIFEHGVRTSVTKQNYAIMARKTKYMS